MGNWLEPLGLWSWGAIILPLAVLLRRGFGAWLYDRVVYLVEGLTYYVGIRLQKSIAAGLSLQRYCRFALEGETRFLPVPARVTITIPTDRMYVPLSVSIAASADRLLRHDEVLDSGQRIVVIGDPGCGKTSLIKRVYRDLCRDAIRSPGTAQLPIRVELRDVPFGDIPKEADEGVWLLTRIRSELGQSSVFRMDDCFDAYLRTNGVVFLFDGLDEVASSGVSSAVRSLRGLSRLIEQKSPNNKLLVSTRTHFFSRIQSRLEDLFDSRLLVQPFTSEDQFLFLARWPFGRERARHIGRIHADLVTRPTLRDMCRNPLVLAMYVAEDQVDPGQLVPESRTEFYRRVTSELLVNRRARHDGEQTGQRLWTRELRERVLGRIAFEHLLDLNERLNSIPWQQAVDTVADVVGCTPAAAADALDGIAKETGLVSEEREFETLRFIHLTFCEFLCALEAVDGRQDGWNMLMELARTDSSREDSALGRLYEVLPFAVGLMPKWQRPRALHDVESLGDPELLARCILEAKHFQHAALLNYVTSEFETLTEGRDQAMDIGRLRRIHLYNVVLSEAIQTVEEPTALARYGMDEVLLRASEGDSMRLESLLKVLVEHDATEALHLTEGCGIDLIGDFGAIAMRGLEQPAFLGLLMQRVLEDADSVETWATFLARAGLGSFAVANAIAGAEIPRHWSTRIDALPRDQRWCDGRIADRNLFTAALTLTDATSVTRTPAGVRLSAVLGTRAPGSYVPIWLTALIVGGLGGIGLVSGLAGSSGWLLAAASVCLAAGVLSWVYVFLVSVAFWHLLYSHGEEGNALSSEDRTLRAQLTGIPEFSGAWHVGTSLGGIPRALADVVGVRAAMWMMVSIGWGFALLPSSLRRSLRLSSGVT